MSWRFLWLLIKEQRAWASLEQNVLSMGRFLLFFDDLRFQCVISFMLGLLLPGNPKVLKAASAVSCAASNLISSGSC